MLKLLTKKINKLFHKEQKRFFTSDLHFGHRNVITYCNRPFKDVDEMNEWMVKTWNETVGKDDIVYCLGDFSLNPKVAGKFVKRLNGHIILISGNHDATFIRHKKHVKMIERYLEDGFKAVLMHDTLELKDRTRVIMSHLPYRTEESLKYDTRYIDYRLEDKGSILLHGHIHGRYKKLGRLIDVGIDAHMKILSEDEVLELIHSKEEFISSHLTEFYKNRIDVNREHMEGM